MNIPAWKLFGWFRRPQLWATGDWQLHRDNTPIHALRLMQSFLVKHQIAQVTQPLYSPDLAPCNFWLFPKLKSSLKKREEISDHWQDSGKYDRAAHSNWRDCVGSQGNYFEGDRGVIVLCTMFLVSSSMSLFFILHGYILSGQISSYMLGYTTHTEKCFGSPNYLELILTQAPLPPKCSSKEWEESNWLNRKYCSTRRWHKYAKHSGRAPPAISLVFSFTSNHICYQLMSLAILSQAPPWIMPHWPQTSAVKRKIFRSSSEVRALL